MFSRRSISFALLAFGAACGTSDAPPGGAATTATAAPPIPVVTVHATDYAFAMPDTLDAGLTTLQLVDDGTEFHHVQLFRLDDGHTLADLLPSLQNPGPLPAWAHSMGGPNTPVPGDTTSATVDLPAGAYAAVCFIPSPDGTPHIMKGMSRAFVVRPVTRQVAATAPVADVTLTLDDYKFGLSQPLTAGRHVLRIDNAAAQDHEVVFVVLEPGKTPADVAAFLEKHEGPPPGRPIAGVTAIAKGVSNYITLDLVPGDYALLCFVPDATDGKPHVAHGMMQQIHIG